MIKDLLANIVNKKDEDNQLLYTGTVYSMEPLQVKLYPGDDPINVKSIVGAIGITNGSNVLMVKHLSKFIIIGVVGSPMTKFTDYVIKQSDDTRNNTTTLEDDSELTLTLPPNGIYEIETRLFVDAASSTPEFKMDYDYSNVTQLQYRNCLGPGTNATSAYNMEYIHFHGRSMATDTIYGTVASGWVSIWEKFIVETGDDEGTITLRHAQNVATVEDVKVKANSLMKYTRIDSFPILGAGEGGAATPAESPIGSVTQFAGSSAPTGWLLCDGSAVSRTTYSDLFGIISTTYGVGDGSTTFNLPDMQGKVPVGYNSSDADFDALGETGGAKTHTLTSGEMPSHTHTQNSHTHTQNSHTHTQNSHDHTQDSHDHTVRWKLFDGLSAGSTWILLRRTDGSDSYDGTDSDAANAKTANNQSTTATNQSTTATNQSTTATNQNTGGGSSHNNLQPYITLNYIIKT